MERTGDKLTLRPSEAAELMQVSKPTMYELCRREDFPVIHIGRKLLIPKAALMAWLNKQAIKM